MRVVLIGVSHWHAPHYYRALAKLSTAQNVGVSDPNPAALQRVCSATGAPGFADYRQMLDAQKPDFAFVFARHSQLAATAQHLVEKGIPFVVEKPAGMNRSEVAALRDAVAAKGLHAGTGFNFRVSDFYREVTALLKDDEATWASFRFIAGSPQRYRDNGCDWMLDPATSGGGSCINLSVHLFDLFRQFTRSDPSQVTALMGHQSYGLPIEDYAAVTLRSAKAVCTTESGYSFPGKTLWDLRFCVRMHQHYVILRNDNMIEIYRNDTGALREVATAASGNAYWYAAFVEESLARFAQDRPPVADLDDLVAAMAVVDAAYASDRQNGQAQVPVG